MKPACGHGSSELASAGAAGPVSAGQSKRTPSAPSDDAAVTEVTTRSIRAASAGLWVAISAADPLPAHQRPAIREHAVRGGDDRDCRSARRPAAGAARWPARGRWPRAAARRRRAAPAGGSARSPRPELGRAAARARLPRRAARDAGDHLRQRHVLQRGELRQQVVELVDEADGGRGAARCARRRTACRQSRPAMKTSPASGCSSRPATCSRVDLPEPDGPIRATISPARRSRSSAAQHLQLAGRRGGSCARRRRSCERRRRHS